MPKMFNPSRVEEAARFIAGELKTFLDRRNIDSPISERLREACPAYEAGMTNGERLLATLRALSMAQIEISADVTTLTDGDEEDDEAEAA